MNGERTRRDVLASLLRCELPLEQLESEFRRFPWDAAEPLVELTRVGLLHVLQGAVSGQVRSRWVATS